MPLYRNEFDVIELSHTSIQGWHTLGRLTVAAAEGWRVVSAAAVGQQMMLVLVSRRRWFWRRRR